jgi:hypothetical protein
VWVDALSNAQLQSLTNDATSARIPANGQRGLALQNLSPYVVKVLSDTDRILAYAPPWTALQTTELLAGCSYVVAQTDVAASPATLAKLLQLYSVRIRLLEQPLHESLSLLPSQ